MEVVLFASPNLRTQGLFLQNIISNHRIQRTFVYFFGSTIVSGDCDISGSFSFGEEKKWEFRMDQLAFRRFEIYQAYAAIKELVNNGERGTLEAIDGDPIDWGFLTGKVELDSLQMVGHSFGGSTLVCRLFLPFKTIIYGTEI
jgi:Platelet-activating factor acetylhydrolase, isoform II